MRKHLVATIAVSGLILNGVAFSATANKPTAPRANEFTYVGDISSVSVRNHELVVKGTEKVGPSEMKFEVPLGTRIQIAGSPVLLAQLERGEHVTVTYRTVEERPTALSIRHHGKKATD